MPGYVHLTDSSELSDRDLEHYVLGRTSAEVELAHVEQHLTNCPACAERAAAMTNSIARLIGVFQRFDLEEADISR